MDSVLNSVSPVPGLLPNICRMRHLILCIRIGKDFLRKVLLALILKNDFDRNLGKLSLIHSSCIYWVLTVYSVLFKVLTINTSWKRFLLSWIFVSWHPKLKKKILTEIKWQKIRINICPKLYWQKMIVTVTGTVLEALESGMQVWIGEKEMKN